MKSIAQIVAVFWAGVAVVGFLGTLLLMRVFPPPQPYEPYPLQINGTAEGK